MHDEDRFEASWAAAEQRLIARIRDEGLSPLMRMREAYRAGFDAGHASGQTQARVKTYQALHTLLTTLGMESLRDDD